MLNLFRTPYVRRLEEENAELRAKEMARLRSPLQDMDFRANFRRDQQINDLKYETAELRKQVAELQERDALVQQVGKLRGDLWSVMAGPSNTLALIASKDKEIEALKKTVRDLKRERDRAGRFAPCEK